MALVVQLQRQWQQQAMRGAVVSEVESGNLGRRLGTAVWAGGGRWQAAWEGSAGAFQMSRPAARPRARSHLLPTRPTWGYLMKTPRFLTGRSRMEKSRMGREVNTTLYTAAVMESTRAWPAAPATAPQLGDEARGQRQIGKVPNPLKARHPQRLLLPNLGLAPDAETQTGVQLYSGWTPGNIQQHDS